MFGRMLLAADYEVFGAKDGLEGVEKAKSMIPDLIIADVNMPNLDGLGLCHILKRNPLTAHIPVLFLTGMDTIGDAEKALKEGPDGYITKPCDPDRLLAKVESLLEKNKP
jgi:CheY-like chemotaxis protein